MNRTLTAVPGVLAGHHTHESGTTGVTAVLFPGGARAACAVPGSATGTREVGVLDPSHLAGVVHGLCLAGGSAFGLAAADGVMAVLEARGVGFDTGHGRVPIVPAAILFDLHSAAARPDAAMGRLAAEAATDAPLGEGRVGAAAGARVGKASARQDPGGTGTWATPLAGYTVGVVAAVNALGSVRDPETGAWVAGAPPHDEGPELVGDWRGQTTLVVVATDAPLSRPQLGVLAKMATAGLARTLYPAFSPFDGDIVFAASTAAEEGADALVLARVGQAAARCVERAVVRGVTRG